jgi:hypothetical protein
MRKTNVVCSDQPTEQYFLRMMLNFERGRPSEASRTGASRHLMMSGLERRIVERVVRKEEVGAGMDAE